MRGEFSPRPGEPGRQHPGVPPLPLILVVDDDDTVRAMLARLLEAHGYAVVQAADSEAATAALRGPARPDLVVSDVVMPGRSGIELRRLIAGIAPGLPVILVSGYSPDAPAEFAENEPGTHFVPKPFAVNELLALVEETLAAHP